MGARFAPFPMSQSDELEEGRAHWEKVFAPFSQRFARRTRCGLATEIFPLAQNENSKKKRSTYRKLSNEVLRAVGGWISSN